jgi:hypothetical protein
MPDKADTPSSPEDDASIDIDTDSDTLAVLVGILTGKLPTETPPSSFHVIQNVLAFGGQYGFTNLPRMMLPFMHNYAMSHGWDVFVFAAKNDFPVLAAHAVDKLGSPELVSHTILNLDFSMLDGIPIKYAGPLVRNMTLFRTEIGATDWRQVSLNFLKLEEVSLPSSALLTAEKYRASYPSAQALLPQLSLSERMGL